MESAKKRIEFIDLAKGVCITLVVMFHLGIDTLPLGLEVMRMPFYFILSGLFFKPDEALVPFLTKKINNILIPFIFFFLIGFCVDFLSSSSGSYLTVGDMVFRKQLLIYPIWFLLALFWSNLFYLLIYRLFPNSYLQIFVVVFVCYCGNYCGQYRINLPLYMDVACSALPFFVLGRMLRATPILYPNRYDRYIPIIVPILYLVCLVFSLISDPKMDLAYNIICDPYCAYCLGILSPILLLMICKQIVHLPILSYLGRHSLIVLCVHSMIIVGFIRLGLRDYLPSFVLLIFTLIGCLGLIPICKKIIPWFVAQKPLIPVTEISFLELINKLVNKLRLRTTNL